MANRPTFLSIICILLAIYGIIVMIGGIMIVAVGNDGAVQDALKSVGMSSSFFNALGAISIIVGLIALVVAYLLWKGISLGWFLALIFLGINAILGILSFPAGLLILIVTVLLIWYFLRPNVREFFGT
jgi:hypothetical protein